MDPQRVLVALGGNAIAGERGAGPDAQRVAVEEAAVEPADLVAAGHRAGELRALVVEGHFANGSMGPKVDAALRFVEDGGRQAAITSLERLRVGVAGTAGTIVRA